MNSLQLRLEQRPEATRFPWCALLWSLVLHAGLLAGWSVPPDNEAVQGMSATVLQGVLLPAPPRIETSPPIAAVKPQDSAAPVSKVLPASALPKAALPPLVAVPPVPEKGFPAVTPTFNPPAMLPDAGGKTESPAAGNGLSASTGVPANVALATTVAASALGLDPVGLRQYRLALAGEARRFRRYPDAARRAGLSGTTEVRVTVAAGGLAERTELSRSSGHAALDTAALEMLRQAATRAVLPASLRGQSFVVLLPVVFEVEE